MGEIQAHSKAEWLEMRMDMKAFIILVMPRFCSVCASPRRTEIDQSVVSGSATLRDIARQFGLSKDAVARHKEQHMVPMLAAAAQRRADEGDSLAERISTAHKRSEALYDSAEAILRRAVADQDSKTALKSISAAVSIMGEGRQWAELYGQLSGELQSKSAVGPVQITVRYVTQEPGWAAAKRAESQVVDIDRPDEIFKA